MDKQRAITLIKEFLIADLSKEGWFSSVRPFLKAVILYGSVAKETNRPDSDIDILLIMPLDIEEKYTMGEYFYDYREQKINIVIRSIEKLRRIAEEKNDIFQKKIFRGAEILEETDDEVRKLLKDMEKINA